MDQMQVLVLVAGVTTMIVGAIKKAFSKWTDGKEELLSMAVPVLIIPILKLSHVVELTWASVVVTILLAGAGAGVLHDKVVNPLLAGKGQPPTDA